MIILLVTDYWVTYSQATSNVWSVRLSPPLLSEAGNACGCVCKSVISLSFLLFVSCQQVDELIYYSWYHMLCLSCTCKMANIKVGEKRQNFTTIS